MACHVAWPCQEFFVSHFPKASFGILPKWQHWKREESILLLQPYPKVANQLVGLVHVTPLAPHGPLLHPLAFFPCSPLLAATRPSCPADIRLLDRLMSGSSALADSASSTCIRLGERALLGLGGCALLGALLELDGLPHCGLECFLLFSLALA